MSSCVVPGDRWLTGMTMSEIIEKLGEASHRLFHRLCAHGATSAITLVLVTELVL